MGNLLTISYWFRLRPDALSGSGLSVLLVALALLLGAALVFSLLKKRKNNGLYRKIWLKLANFSISNFVIGLFLLFFTFEQLPFLAMRLWFLLWLAGMALWLVYIIKQMAKIPEIKKEIEEKIEYNKYIP